MYAYTWQFTSTALPVWVLSDFKVCFTSLFSMQLDFIVTLSSLDLSSKYSLGIVILLVVLLCVPGAGTVEAIARELCTYLQ